ncbi:MAG TPA: hypothetical protein VFV77_02235 [Gammaproteobacteria bacterium]|nr:hypothetical protein [Gammaproteobacteria bacterium]
MRRIRIYHNPNCAKCARYARLHERLDWLNRVEISTDTPVGSQPLCMGEVVVEDFVTGELLHGAAALAAICRQIPAYAPMRVLLKIPAVRRAADKEMAGCNDGSCELPQEGR